MSYDITQGMTRQEALALGVSLDYCPVRDRYWLQGEMPLLLIPVDGDDGKSTTFLYPKTLLTTIIPEPVSETPSVTDSTANTDSTVNIKDKKKG